MHTIHYHIGNCCQPQRRLKDSPAHHGQTTTQSNGDLSTNRLQFYPVASFMPTRRRRAGRFSYTSTGSRYSCNSATSIGRSGSRYR